MIACLILWSGFHGKTTTFPAWWRHWRQYLNDFLQHHTAKMRKKIFLYFLKAYENRWVFGYQISKMGRGKSFLRWYSLKTNIFRPQFKISWQNMILVTWKSLKFDFCSYLADFSQMVPNFVIFAYWSLDLFFISPNKIIDIQSTWTQISWKLDSQDTPILATPILATPFYCL